MFSFDLRDCRSNCGCKFLTTSLRRGVEGKILCIQTQLKLCHKISKVTLSKESDPFRKSIFFFEVSLSSEVCGKLLVKLRRWIGLFFALFTLPITFYITYGGFVCIYTSGQSQNSCGSFKYKFYTCQPPAILTSIERDIYVLALIALSWIIQTHALWVPWRIFSLYPVLYYLNRTN